MLRPEVCRADPSLVTRPDEPSGQERPVAGVRAAIVAVAVAVFVGAAAVVEATAAGMGWTLRVATLAVLAVGISSMVRIGLAQPLADAALYELRKRISIEAELDELRALDELLVQVDDVLDMCTSEPDVFRTLGRAVTSILPDRENALLVSRPTVANHLGAERGGDNPTESSVRRQKRNPCGLFAP